MKLPHTVPLSRQSVYLLQELGSFSNRSEYLFACAAHPQRPLSENTLNVALGRPGYSRDEMTSHGFRATASTLLNESGLRHLDAIERALAHGEANKVRAALSSRRTLGGAGAWRSGGPTASISCASAARWSEENSASAREVHAGRSSSLAGRSRQVRGQRNCAALTARTLAGL